MEIRFCSVCNESVPDSDFDSGRALINGAESLHVACALRRSLEGRSFGRVLMGVLVLYAAAVSTFLLARSFQSGSEQGPAVPEATRTHVAEQLAQAETRSRAWVDTRTADLRQQIVDETVPALREDIKRLTEEQSRALEDRVAENTRIVHDRLKEISDRLLALEQRASGLTQWRLEIQKQADALEVALEGARSRGPSEAVSPVESVPQPTPPPTESTDEVKAREELIAKWIERLADSDDNVVFTATIELARLKAVGAGAALIQVLEKHRDFYARLGAATALGEIPVLEGMSALVEALGDRDELVRTAADDSLRKITGEDFNFSSSLPKNDRARIQRRWRQYWKDNETALRQRLGQ